MPVRHHFIHLKKTALVEMLCIKNLLPLDTCSKVRTTTTIYYVLCGFSFTVKSVSGVEMRKRREGREGGVCMCESRIDPCYLF